MSRQHLIAARRTILGDSADSGYETQQLCVGFVDLVESTALSQQLSTRELGGVIAEFERLASEAVTEAGGRVVKLIGDEILFSAPDPGIGCLIARTIVTTFRDNPTRPARPGRIRRRNGDAPRRRRLRPGREPGREGRRGRRTQRHRGARRPRRRTRRTDGVDRLSPAEGIR